MSKKQSVKWFFWFFYKTTKWEKICENFYLWNKRKICCYKKLKKTAIFFLNFFILAFQLFELFKKENYFDIQVFSRSLNLHKIISFFVSLSRSVIARLLCCNNSGIKFQSSRWRRRGICAFSLRMYSLKWEKSWRRKFYLKCYDDAF